MINEERDEDLRMNEMEFSVSHHEHKSYSVHWLTESTDDDDDVEKIGMKKGPTKETK